MNLVQLAELRCVGQDKLFVEYDMEYIGEHVVSSKVRPATDDDVKSAMQKSSCDHSIIYDEPSWLYDVRTCAICGRGLGAI